MSRCSFLDIHFLTEVKYFISYFYSTTKHEIIQIKNYNLLCSFEVNLLKILFHLYIPQYIKL